MSGESNRSYNEDPATRAETEQGHLQSRGFLCTGLHLEKEHGEDQTRPGGGQLRKRCGQTESAGES